jgi:hypothetical protein
MTEATAWATGSDEVNARAIRQTRGRADLLIRLRRDELRYTAGVPPDCPAIPGSP